METLLKENVIGRLDGVRAQFSNPYVAHPIAALISRRVTGPFDNPSPSERERYVLRQLTAGADIADAFADYVRQAQQACLVHNYPEFREQLARLFVRETLRVDQVGLTQIAPALDTAERQPMPRVRRWDESRRAHSLVDDPSGNDRQHVGP